MTIIDTSFNFHKDSNGLDPDKYSPTLKSFHKKLWSKSLPNGKAFVLNDDKINAYLYHKSELGLFYLGSDAITHSYKKQKRKKGLISLVENESKELFDRGSCMASYLLFPNRQIDRKFTINQARGVNHLIDDRFDLTLECIKRYYQNKKSPLYDCFKRYSDFFQLFSDFQGYTDFFLLQDLLDTDGRVKFYLPFDDFNTPPRFNGRPDYLEYKERVINFINSRTKRIKRFMKNVSE